MFHTQAAGCATDVNLRFGTPMDDQIHGSVKDDNGNLYLVGFENGVLGVENFWPTGNAMGFVEKRSVDGALLWRRTFDTMGVDLVEKVALDVLRNGIVIAGRTNGAFSGFVNAGQMDLFVALLDTEGNVVSFGQFGDDRPQHPVGLTVLPDGDIIVAGYDDVFVQGNAVMDWENGIVARFHVDQANVLNTVWWARSPLASSDFILAIVSLQDGTGDIVVATHNSMSAQQGGGVHIRRTTGQGNLVRSKTVSTNPLDFVTNLALSATGKLYATGATVLSLFAISLGNSDAFLLEIDPSNGATVWGRQFGTLGGDWINSLAVDSMGNLSVLGLAQGAVTPGFSVPVAQGDTTSFAMTFSGSGRWLGTWQSPVPSFGADEYNSDLTVLSGCSNKTAVVAGSAKREINGLQSWGGI